MWGLPGRNPNAPADAAEEWRRLVARTTLVGALRQDRFEREVLEHPDRAPAEDECPDAEGWLHLGGVGHFGYRVLGRVAPDGGWRWAEQDEQIEPGRRLGLSGLHHRRGPKDSWLLDPTGAPIDPADAAALGLVVFDAHGAHLVPQADGSALVVLVMSDELERLPLPYERLAELLTRIAAVTPEDDHGAVIDGWLQHGGEGLEAYATADDGVEVVATGLQGFAVGTTWWIDRVGERIVGVRSSLDGGTATDGAAGSRVPPQRGDMRADDDRSPDPGPAVVRRDAGPVWSSLFARHALTAALRQVRLRSAVLEHPDRAADGRWDLDTAEGALVLSGLAPFPAQLLGTAPTPDAWWWAWEEAGTPDAPTLRDAHRLREELEPLLGDAVDDTTDLDLELAAVVALGVLDADAYYVATGPAGEGLVVLLDDPRIGGARVPYELLPSVLTALIGVRAVPHRDLVAGWRAARPLGLRFADEADGAVLVRAEGLPATPDGEPDPAEGGIWRIEFDDQDRITGVRGVLGGG